MTFFDTALDRIGKWIADRLEGEGKGYDPFTPSDVLTLSKFLQPGDLLLVDGNQKISTAIKYLTQSTWSHVAIYVGDALPKPDDGSAQPTLIEANLGTGVTAVPLSRYECFNTRICRPVGLTPEDREEVIDFMVKRLGYKYDTRNIFDLARYLFPTPPVPTRFRRRMIALGSGEPTKAICSTLIAQAFQSVKYPILPRIERASPGVRAKHRDAEREILHIRHHSLFTPRDFDLSPYFKVIKPTVETGFDYKALTWGEAEPGEGALPSGKTAGGRITRNS